jgi:phosphotransferase system HPr-like phosphotransfer protein
MGLMTLAAANGTKLVIEAKGDDAVAAADALQSLVEKNFNEA